MKKNGFVFIETIITVVFLSASLILLYYSYSDSYHNEKERLYYDDVASIYKTNYIRKFLLKNTNIQSIKDNFGNKYIETITKDQIKAGMQTSFENISKTYNISQIIIVKKEYFTECFEDENNNCKSVNLSVGMKNYLTTLSDTSNDFYLVIEYAEKNTEEGKIGTCNVGVDTKCSIYYTNLWI